MTEPIDPSEYEPEFQSGKKTVDAKNLDAAGDGHPLGSDPLSFEAESMQVLIRDFADGQYSSWRATIREYLANAETAVLRTQNAVEAGDRILADESYEPKIEVVWDKKERKLTIKDNGVGIASVEMENIFRMVGSSANRNTGQYSGQFGMGALSFVKFIGLDNSMLMKTHSRFTDENYAAYVSLSGPEPVMGKLGEEEYGTIFQMNAKDSIDRVRDAVGEYAEWMRVPVLYREYDESGEECFNEDWGDKSFTEEYAADTVTVVVEKEGYFKATASPDAEGQTLLLSMPIDRNDGSSGTKKFDSPFNFDVRLMDESGKVVKSTNGNEGLMPCTRGDYTEMLLTAREESITPSLLNNEEGVTVDGETLVAGEASDDELIGGEVTVGPHKGREVVTEESWNEMEKGEAQLFVPQDELEQFDPSSGEGDLTLPEPTTDRDRLKEHKVFWKFLGNKIRDQLFNGVEKAAAMIEQDDDPIQAVIDLDTQELATMIMENTEQSDDFDERMVVVE